MKKIQMKPIKEYFKDQKAALKKFPGNPYLVIISVGDDEASKVYTKGKVNDCKEVGFSARHIVLPSDTTQDELDDVIVACNKNDEITGIIVQLPLPEHLTVDLTLIDRKKDVDGFRKDSYYLPCTPMGIMDYLSYNEIDLEGKHCVIIGRSDIVGKPMARLMTNANATVTLCHSKTNDLSKFTKMADIIIVATGHPHTLTKDMIGENQIIFDVGINRVDGKLCGDCDYDDIVEHAAYISPVPGGVGLLTRLSLLDNVYVSGIIDKILATAKEFEKNE